MMMVKKIHPKHQTAGTQSVMALKGIVRKPKESVPVEVTNETIAMCGQYTLAELLNQMPDGVYVDQEWERMRPVGKEILD
ncbi:MAG: hypothetical protein KJ589_17280 [Proteobacteria bacterium]|nr:hypothetical protein [Pseudomonadota bacterium]